jgi:hypothetical protein
MTVGLHLSSDFSYHLQLLIFLLCDIYNDIYISNAITRITCPTFPPLIQRGVCEPKHHFELFKFLSSKRFGEDVHNLLICGTMSQVNSPGLYMISNQMVFCVNVLGSIMEFEILGQFDCRRIVN